MKKAKVILLVPTYNSEGYFDFWAESIYRLRLDQTKLSFLKTTQPTAHYKNV